MFKMTKHVNYSNFVIIFSARLTTMDYSINAPTTQRINPKIIRLVGN